MKKTFTTKVVKDDESGELGFLLPEELLQELNLQVGQLLEWKIEDNNTVIITKTNILDSKQ